MKKRMISLVLSVVLALSPVSTAFAADTTEELVEVDAAEVTVDADDVEEEETENAEDAAQTGTAEDAQAGETVDETEGTEEETEEETEETVETGIEETEEDAESPAEDTDEAAYVEAEETEALEDDAAEEETEESEDEESEEVEVIEMTLEAQTVTSEALMAATGTSKISSSTPVLEFDTTYSDELTADDTKFYYEFDLEEAGEIEIDFEADVLFPIVKIYDESTDQIYSKTLSWNSNTEKTDVTLSIDLTAGTYYMSVTEYNSTSNCIGTYEFELGFTSANESFAEEQGGSNNLITTADTISTGTTYRGQLAVNDDVDFYTFTLANSGEIDFTMTSYDMYYSRFCLYSEDETKLLDLIGYEDSNTETATIEKSVFLTAGTYYIKVLPYCGYTGNYNFKVNFTKSSESFPETNGGINNTLATASSISTNITYSGQLAKNDTVDYFKFKISKADTVTISGTVYDDSRYFKLYDADGNQVKYSYVSISSTTNKGTLSMSVSLSAGTYYLAVCQCGSSTGRYSFKVGLTLSSSNISLGATSYKYNGSVRTPSVTVKTASGKTLTKGTDYTVTYASGRKAIGTYKVTITGKGNYSGTVTKTFKIVPKTMSVKSAKSSAKKKVTVKWTKTGGSVTKYQIRYRVKGTSTWKTKTVSSSKSSLTLTGLKSGKTYQVQIRAYKTVSGTTYAGAWSSSKNVKVK